MNNKIEQPIKEIKDGEVKLDIDTFQVERILKGETNSSENGDAKTSEIKTSCNLNLPQGDKQIDTCCISDTNKDVLDKKNNDKSCETKPNLTIQDGSIIGKFKDAKTLLEAYNNLQSEFTRKSQRLAFLEKQFAEIENNSVNKKSKNDENQKDLAFVTSQTNSQNNLSVINLNDKQINSDNMAESQNDYAGNNINLKTNQTIENKSFSDVFQNANGLASEENSFCDENKQKSETIDDFIGRNSGSEKYKKMLMEIVERNGLSNLPNKYQLTYNLIKVAESELAKNLNDPTFVDKFIFNNELIKSKVITDYLSNLNNHSVPSVMSGASPNVYFSPSSGAPKTIKEAGELFSKMLK